MAQLIELSKNCHLWARRCRRCQRGTSGPCRTNRTSSEDARGRGSTYAIDEEGPQSLPDVVTQWSDHPTAAHQRNLEHFAGFF